MQAINEQKLANLGSTTSMPADKWQQATERAKKLLKWLMATYPTMGNQFASPEASEELLRAWTGGIIDLSVEDLKKGCQWCRNNGNQFAPSLPTFRLRAKGLPGEDEAFILAVRTPNAHPLIMAARAQIGDYQWRTMRETDLARMFRSVYATLCGRILDGETVADIQKDAIQLQQLRDAPPPRLDNVPSVPSTLAVAEKYLALMRHTLRGKGCKIIVNNA